jgi:hypothetical protein
MMQFVSSDSQTMLDDETVDSVRLIKTNKEFYVKLITLFLKFKEGNSDKFACQDMTSEFSSFACQRLAIA